jgi:hypothetical protein
MSVAAEPDPTPGYRRLLAYADEAGITSQTYSGFGALWMPWERRGDFQKLLRTVREAHHHTGSLASTHAPADLLTDLVDEVFRRRWLAFRCVITPTTADDTRRRRALVELIARRARPTPPAPPADLRLRLSRAARLADGVGSKPQHAIARALTAQLAPEQPLSVRAARTIDGVELVELLTGIVVYGWERRTGSKDKKRVADRVAENLGWGDLAADTAPGEWKFNIWYLKDPAELDANDTPQRAVQLLLPMLD